MDERSGICHFVQAVRRMRLKKEFKILRGGKDVMRSGRLSQEGNPEDPLSLWPFAE